MHHVIFLIESICEKCSWFTALDCIQLIQIHLTRMCLYGKFHPPVICPPPFLAWTPQRTALISWNSCVKKRHFFCCFRIFAITNFYHSNVLKISFLVVRVKSSKVLLINLINFFYYICDFQVQLLIYFMLKYAMEILLSESSVVSSYYFGWTTSKVSIFLASLGLTVLPINIVVGNYISNMYEDR